MGLAAITGTLSQNIAADDGQDVLTAYGVRISGELLRTLHQPTPPGVWFRVVNVENGLATIQTKREDQK